MESPIFEDEPLSLTTEQKDQLLQLVIEERNRFKRMMDPHKEKALEVRQLYLDNRPSSQSFTNPDIADGSMSNVRMPVIAQAVDATHAQQYQSMFPTDERFFSAEPLNRSSKDVHTRYEDHTEDRMERLGFLSKVYRDLLNRMLDGVSLAYHPFIRKTRKRMEYKSKTAFGLIPLPVKPTKTEVEQVYLEFTDFVPLNYEDWWIDPTVDELEDTPVIWRRWVSIEEIKKEERFKDTEDVATYGKACGDEASRLSLNYSYLGISVSTGDKEHPMSDSHAMLFERWGDFWIDEKLYENHVLIYSNESHVHYFGPNPYDHGMKPFSICPYVPVPGTLLGKSLGHDIVPLAHAYDTFMNQSIDVLSAHSSPIHTYLANDEAFIAFTNGGKVPIRPGMLIPVRNHDTLRPLQADLQNLSVVSQFMQNTKQEIRESTGGVSYATGGISELDPNRTATEVNVLAGGTSTRYQNLIQFYEHGKLRPYLWMIFENDRQFMSEPVLIGDDEEQLTPNKMKTLDFEFCVTGSKTTMSQQKEAQAMSAILDRLPDLLQLPNVQVKGDLVSIDVIEIFKQFARAIGAKNIDTNFEVIVSEQEQEAKSLGDIGIPQELFGGLQQPDPTAAIPSVGVA